MPSISKTYTFDAAHHLPNLPDGHKCKRIHGHTYEVEVTLRAPIDQSTGFILDYADLDRCVKPLIDAFDHQDLNLWFPQGPTAERLAIDLHERITAELAAIQFAVVPYGDQPGLSVRVSETPKTSAVYP